MKWLFLLCSSATATISMLMLGGIAAGKHPLSCLQLFSQEPHSLSLLVLLAAAWAGFINDIAATANLSHILGHSVQFREINMYGDLESNTQITSLKTKLYAVYPVAMTAAFAVLVVSMARM